MKHFFYYYFYFFKKDFVRSATVRAKTWAELMSISADALNIVFKAFPAERHRFVLILFNEFSFFEKNI